MGRAGRGGDQSICVFLRKKGEKTPPEMKPYLKPDSPACLKKGMVDIFTLKDPDGEIVLIHNFFFFSTAIQIIIFCSQWFTTVRRRTLDAVWPAVRPVGASAASVGWYHCAALITDNRCLKVLQ